MSTREGCTHEYSSPSQAVHFTDWMVVNRDISQHNSRVCHSKLLKSAAAAAVRSPADVCNTRVCPITTFLSQFLLRQTCGSLSHTIIPAGDEALSC